MAAGCAFTGLVGAEGMRLGMVMFGAESVTLAARLMMKARLGSALVSADVRAATQRHIRYEGEGEPELAGGLLRISTRPTVNLLLLLRASV